MFIYMVIVNVMKMSVVDEVHVPVMFHCFVSAVASMLMLVRAVSIAAHSISPKAFNLFKLDKVERICQSIIPQDAQTNWLSVKMESTFISLKALPWSIIGLHSVYRPIEVDRLKAATTCGAYLKTRPHA